MLKSLDKIQNPLVRSLTAAVTVGSAITMAAAITLGITHAKENGLCPREVWDGLI